MREYQVHDSMAFKEGAWPDSHHDHFASKQEAPRTHWIGWVGPRANLNSSENRKISCPSWKSNHF